MGQNYKVSVFEACDEMVQIQIVKKKLEDAGIACSVSKYLNNICPHQLIGQTKFKTREGKHSRRAKSF